MSSPPRRHRVILIGAGFSVLAGLPLGNDLLRRVIELSRSYAGPDNHLIDDLEAFAEYKRRADGWDGDDPLSLNLEEFMSFLEVEHVLGLRGSDTWSREGNEGQLLVRQLIGQVIHDHTPRELPEAYLRFAERLLPSDIVLTLNYDLVLERALDQVGRTYRLFPLRRSQADPRIVDTSDNEVILLKLHGSIDWFDDTDYVRLRESFRKQGCAEEPRDVIFGDRERYHATCIVDGPRDEDDLLCHVHRIRDVDGYYRDQAPGVTAPFVIAPSFTKLLYMQPLLEFWYSVGRSGGWLNFDVIVVGCSLTAFDQYVRQALYRVVRNFQFDAEPELELMGMRKSHLKLIGYCPNEESLEAIRASYRFVDWSRTDLWTKGFGPEAVEYMFRGE